MAPYLCPELQAALMGKDVIHFADNKAANGVARKGYSGSRDLGLAWCVSRYVRGIASG